ncbi:MAG: CRISPR-associated endonuclease Cas1 [Nitrospinae bacterium]|nr:CRISPR-associated endonuclease Cas1 [Nitrospinota bacterium]MBF0633514.1 CRISPR-associated endonuclease Cas1 [Nitrospinota bacterium]
MPTLYVSEPNSTLRLSGESLNVTTVDDEQTNASPSTSASPTSANSHHSHHSRVIASVEPHLLEMVAIIGHNHITSDALLFCLEKGICVAWLTRGGKLLGRCIPDTPRNADLRISQYQLATNEADRLHRAISVVTIKLANCAEVLKDIRSNEDDGAILSQSIADLEQSSATAATATSADQLLGVEGSAARVYFAAYGSAFRGEIQFPGRNRRPPKDPANALLSFCYTIVSNQLASLIEARGLDVSIGFFHEMRSGRPSLAIDLLEELRAPIVDRFVLRACNLRILRPEMFEGDSDSQNGVRLTTEGRKIFFYEWEKHLRKPIRVKNAEEKKSPLQIIRDQVEILAASFRGGKEYQPFLYGG